MHENLYEYTAVESQSKVERIFNALMRVCDIYEVYKIYENENYKNTFNY